MFLQLLPLFLAWLKISTVKCVVNISVLHLHDNEPYSKEAVRMVASALNNFSIFNVDVNLVHQQTSECKAIMSRYYGGRPLHLIINTLPHHVKGTVEDLGIPTVSTHFSSDDHDDLHLDHIYRVRQPLEFLQDLVYGLIELLKIDHVLIVYNSRYFYVKDLRLKLQEKDIPHMFIKYNATTPNVKIAKYLNYQHIFFLIYGNVKSLSNIIKTSNEQTWYVVSTTPINTTIDDNVFIEVSRAIPPSFVMSNALDHKENLLFHFYADVAMMAIMAAKDFVHVEDFKPVNCSKLKSSVDLVEYLKQSETIFRIIGLDKNPGFYKFNMRIRNGLSETSEAVGIWSSDFGDDIKLRKGVNWKDQQGRHFKILAVVKPPFIYQNYTESAKLYGYCIDMIEELSRTLNFTYQLYPAITVMDMVEDITKYDLAIGAIKTSAKLMEYLEFTEPFYKPVGMGILMKRSINSSIFKFITVMESTVWICVISAYFINSFMIWAFERWSPYSYRNNPEKFAEEDDNRDFTLKESLWFCIMSITPQGGGDVPKHFSGRMAVITWWIFGFIVLSSYTANLAAFLTLSKLKSSIETIEDLVNQYAIQYATLNNSEEFEFFQDMRDIENLLSKQLRLMGNEKEYEDITPLEYPLENTYTKMLNNMYNTTFPQTLNDALERVMSSNLPTEGFALIGEISDIRYLAMIRCDLEVVGSEMSRIPYALAVRKNSYLKRFLNKGIFDLMSKNRFEHFEKKWWDDNPYKATDCMVPEDHWQGVGVQNIGGVFLIIFVGIGLACLTILYEYLMYKYRQRVDLKVTEISKAKESDDGQTPEIARLEDLEKY